MKRIEIVTVKPVRLACALSGAKKRVRLLPQRIEVTEESATEIVGWRVNGKGERMTFGGVPARIVISKDRIERRRRVRRQRDRAWVDSERQGNGRRFWFRTFAEATRFHDEKVAAGYPAVLEESATVWVPFGKKVTDEVRRQQRGIDPGGE